MNNLEIWSNVLYRVSKKNPTRMQETFWCHVQGLQEVHTYFGVQGFVGGGFFWATVYFLEYLNWNKSRIKESLAQDAGGSEFLWKSKAT